jgi:hypothetical protein
LIRVGVWLRGEEWAPVGGRATHPPHTTPLRSRGS